MVLHGIVVYGMVSAILMMVLLRVLNRPPVRHTAARNRHRFRWNPASKWPIFPCFEPENVLFVLFSAKKRGLSSTWFWRECGDGWGDLWFTSKISEAYIVFSILRIDTENFYSPQTNAALHKSNMHQIGSVGINSEVKKANRKKRSLVSA